MANREQDRDTSRAIAEFAEVIDAYSSPLHYGVPVSEEQYQADKAAWLAAQRTTPDPPADTP